MTYSDLVGKGELLLISGAISAAGIGNLIAGMEGNGKLKGTKMSLIAFSMFVIFCTSYLFANIAERIHEASVNSAATASSQAIDAKLVAGISTAIFASAVIASLACIAVAEGSR